MKTCSIIAVVLSLTLSVSADPPVERPAFEVLVVGTVHAPWQFRSRAFHPGHIRAALEASNPDVVGVESNPAWFAKNKFHDVTYEAQAITVPWARARSIPVYGVDWMNTKAWDARTQKSDQARADQLLNMKAGGRFGGWAFGQVGEGLLPKVREYFSNSAFEFRAMNGIGDAGSGKAGFGEKWLAGARTQTPFGGHRNNEIAKRCVEVMTQHPGKRLVVVIGAAHKAVLDELFRRAPGVKLLQWDRDVPAPTDEVAHASLTNDDRLAILGHNLDGERSYFHKELIDMERMHSVLKDFSAHDGDPRLAMYFRARWHMHGERWKAATALLERLEAGETADPAERATPYPFPLNHWRMAYDLPQSVRLELARLRQRRSDLKEQQPAILQALSDEQPTPNAPRDPRWRMQFLAKAFPVFLANPKKAHAVPSTTLVSTNEGWRANDPAHGALPLLQEAKGGAMHFQLHHETGAGLPNFSRRFDLATPGGTWVFRARVRANDVASFKIEAYVWPDGRRAAVVAKQDIDPASDQWQTIELAIDVPATLEAVLVNVYASRTAKGTIWLDDATLEPASKAGK